MKRFLALLAACALGFSLAGCNPAATNPPESSPPESSQPPVSSPGNEADDVIFRVAGVPASTILMTVDGMPITAETFVYWLLYNVSYYDSYMQYYGEVLDWEEYMDNVPLATYFMEDSIEAVKFFALMRTRAALNNCGLTDEQIQGLADERQALIEQFGSEDELSFNLRYAGISEDMLRELNSTTYFYQNLTRHFFGGVDELSEADLIDYVDRQGLLWAKHILIRTLDDAGEPLDEAGQANAKGRAELLLEQLLAVEGEEQAELFDAMMVEFSEDPGLADFPDGYDFGPNEMVPEFEDATRALAYGEITGELVPSDYGYHIIQRVAYPLTDELATECLNAKFDALIAEWLGEVEITESPELAVLDVRSVYEAMLDFRADLEAEHEGAG